MPSRPHRGAPCRPDSTTSPDRVGPPPGPEPRGPEPRATFVGHSESSAFPAEPLPSTVGKGTVTGQIDSCP
ncbi:hypothetical protein E1211_20165 [Micromonospora sp. 15K316]|nr:hypothetical protein E1211_20165 [Micromonospora sp. 15K316]